MSPHRHALTDKEWERLRNVLPRRRTGPSSQLGDRSFIEAVVYRAKTGMPWRDLPERFGPWKAIYNRFSRWARRGVWEEVFKALQIDDDVGSLLDATIVRAHQDAAGGKGGSDAIIWAVLEEAFRPRSTRSRQRKAGRSTSR
jgi:transposase